MQHRHTEIDVLRGIAALMVVFYHYTYRYGEIYAYPFKLWLSFEYGKYGVQLFFIISGFVIFLTLQRSTNIFDFVIFRISRIYPVYWVCVPFTFLVVSIFSLPGREVTINEALINLFMLQHWIGARNVDGVYWTLSVELSFYFLMGILFLTNQLKNINPISIIGLLLVGLVGIVEPYFESGIYWLKTFFPLFDYMNLFIAGIMFFKLMSDRKFFYYFVIFLSLIVEYFLRGNSVIFVGFFYLIFYFVIANKVNFLNVKIFSYFGLISYPLYLVHQNVGYVLINKMRDLGVLNNVTLLFIPLLSSFVIAAAFFKYIERPTLMRIKGRWLNSRIRTILIGRP